VAKRYLFSKKQRLRNNDRFKGILGHKCCAGNDLFKVYVAGNDCGYPRFGVSAPKRCGNAVLRNRLKRLAREAFRVSQHDIATGYDYLLIFTPKVSKKEKLSASLSTVKMTFSQVTESFLRLSDQAVKKASKKSKSIK
jgi:ribonuclease P protein component